MRRNVAILGTLLIAAVILISGSAVATWVYAQSIHSYLDCTNRDEIRYADDAIHATLGNNNETLGWVIVDLGAGNGMGSADEFTVFAYGNVVDNSESEDYDAYVGQTPMSFEFVGSDDDQANQTFTTPIWGSDWRYIKIVGTSGTSPPLSGTDPFYGPEIDAVGWDK